jgi:hypothetical protein
MSLEDARKKLEDWRTCYNEDRPHSGISQIPLVLLHDPEGVSGPSPGVEAENSGFGCSNVRERSNEGRALLQTE